MTVCVSLSKGVTDCVSLCKGVTVSLCKGVTKWVSAESQNVCI